MKKCVIIPDSFKGTLSAIQICDIMKGQVLKHYPDCQITAIPIADGGEGTVDCFLYTLGAEKVEVTVTGPYGEAVSCYYARINTTAIIEMAQAAGLPMVSHQPNPCKTTTYGVGSMMLHAIKAGCTELIIGLGGSCTNDGGVGAALAMGTKFYNKEGLLFAPSGDTLTEISSIDTTETKKTLSSCKVTAMCDIDNPMYGKNGAAYIFAPQKGANEEMVTLLDHNLKALSGVINKCLFKDVSTLPGAGAAGGFGAGAVAFFDGELKSGIHTILDLIHFDELIQEVDMIFTGEGSIDSQSLRGKVVIGVAKRAREQKIPVTAVVGSIGEGAEGAYEFGVTSIFSINTKAMDFSESKHLSASNLEKTMDSLLRFYKASHCKDHAY